MAVRETVRDDPKLRYTHIELTQPSIFSKIQKIINHKIIPQIEYNLPFVFYFLYKRDSS